jgi:undecaprenyl-diphosphatase
LFGDFFAEHGITTTDALLVLQCERMDAATVFIAQYLYLFVLLTGMIFFFLQPRKIQKSMIVCGVIIAPLAYIVSRIAGLLYFDPRPFLVGHFIPLIAYAPDNGFPSDHVLLTGAIAMVIWFYNKKLSVVLLAIALLIGWARVYSGIHNVADIAGSVAIVLAAGAAYAFIIKAVIKGKGVHEKSWHEFFELGIIMKGIEDSK